MQLEWAPMGQNERRKRIVDSHVVEIDLEEADIQGIYRNALLFIIFHKLTSRKQCSSRSGLCL